MFNKKTEKKPTENQAPEKNVGFYDSMIDDILSGEKNNGSKNDAEGTASVTEELFAAEPETGGEERSYSFDGDAVLPFPGESEEISEETEEKATAEEAQKNDHHEIDIHKWKSETITSISEEYSEERVNSNEIDDELLIALGYVNGNQKPVTEADSLLPERLFALDKEFSDVRESEEIYQRLAGEKRKLDIRIIATLAISILLCLYPYVARLLSYSVEFFDCTRFFVPNLFVCLQLLFIAVAFSAGDLLKGFLKLFTAKPTVYSPASLLLLETTASAVLFALLPNIPESIDCSLFCAVASASILIPLFTERARLLQQTTAFCTAADKGSIKSSRIDKCEDGYMIAHRGIPRDLAERTKAPYESPRVMNLTLLPSFVFSTVIGTAVFLITDNAESAFSAASAAACILFPTVQLLTSLPFFHSAASILASEGCAIIGRGSVNELAGIEEMTVSEGEIFRMNASSTVNMQLFNETLYDTIYCTASLTRRKRSPISSLFAENIENEDLSANVQTVEDTVNGTAAIVDNKFAVLCGNAEFMREHDFDVDALAREYGEDSINAVIFTAINGRIAAVICVDYLIREDFLDIANAARAGNVRLKIHSTDFGVTRRMISAKTGLYDDDFELVKEKMPLPTGSSPAVTADCPAALFSVPSVARAIKRAEKFLGIYSAVIPCISAAAAIIAAAIGITVSPYVIFIYHAITALPAFIASAVYLQNKDN